MKNGKPKNQKSGKYSPKRVPVRVDRPNKTYWGRCREVLQREGDMWLGGSSAKIPTTSIDHPTSMKSSTGGMG